MGGVVRTGCMEEEDLSSSFKDKQEWRVRGVQMGATACTHLWRKGEHSVLAAERWEFRGWGLESELCLLVPEIHRGFWRSGKIKLEELAASVNQV